MAQIPECPNEIVYVLEWYKELKGETRLSYTEIKSWAEMTQQAPKAWEVDLLRTLDRIYWEAV